MSDDDTQGQEDYLHGRQVGAAAARELFDGDLVPADRSEAYHQGFADGVIARAGEEVSMDGDHPQAREHYQRGYQTALKEFGEAKPIRVAQLNAAVLMDQLMKNPGDVGGGDGRIPPQTRVVLKAAEIIAMLE